MFPLAKVVPIQPLLDTVERALASTPGGDLPTLVKGQAVSAEVLAVANGLARVRVADTLLALRLPPSFQVGDTLDLLYLGTKSQPGNPPQPSFQLNTPGAPPLTLVARLVTTTPVSASTTPVVSPAAFAVPQPDAPELGTLARLLGAAVADVPAGRPATLTPTEPLLPRAAADPGAMASALRGSVARSGLFYESHLVDWLEGRDTLEGLLREPQNRALPASLVATLLARAGAGQAGLAPSTQPASGLPERATNLPSPDQTAAAPSALAARTTPDNAAPLSTPSASAALAQLLQSLSGGEPGSAPRADAPLSLVSQQLQVLENPSLIWRGELWQGLPLTWQIARDATDPDTHTARAPADAQAGWTSNLLLELPNLGTVKLVLALDAAGDFRIRIAAAEHASTAIRDASPEALTALCDAGCRVADWQIEATADYPASSPTAPPTAADRAS